MFPFISLIIKSCNPVSESNYVIQVLMPLFQHPIDEDFIGLVIEIVESISNMPSISFIYLVFFIQMLLNFLLIPI